MSKMSTSDDTTRNLDAYLRSKGMPTEPKYRRINGFLGFNVNIPLRAKDIEKDLVDALYISYGKADVSIAIIRVQWHEDVSVCALKYPGAKEYSPKEYIEGLRDDLLIFVKEFVSSRGY